MILITHRKPMAAHNPKRTFALNANLGPSCMLLGAQSLDYVSLWRQSAHNRCSGVRFSAFHFVLGDSIQYR